MNQLEPPPFAETVASLTARLATAELALTARDKTIQVLVTREQGRTAKRPSTFGIMEDNASLQQVVACKTLELGAQNTRLSQEIEARKVAEAAQKAQLKFLKTFLDTIPNPVFIKDAEGVYLDCNKVWADQVMGLPKDKIIGRTGFQLPAAIPPDLAKVYHEKDQWLLQNSGVQVYESEVNCADHVRRKFIFTKTVFADAESDTAGIVGVMLDITERKQAEAELAKVHQKLIDASRKAGMAEVATSVLHNIGNVLNSVNIASSCVADGLRKSKSANLAKVVMLLDEHADDLGAFFTSNPKGRQLPGYLGQLAEHLAGEQNAALKELADLQKNIEHIKDIVNMQQSFAKASGLVETLPLTDLVEDALKMNASSLARHDIQVIKEFETTRLVTVEKHKVLQILVNLVRNAKQACDELDPPEKRVTLRVTNAGDRIRIEVTDNGIGIPPENLTRIFAHGFTTKKTGHGFGLHSGALAAKEMDGSLTVHSDGPGQGATFILELPGPNGGEHT